MAIQFALELLEPGQKALCLFTTGLHLEIDEGNETGSSGIWRMNPEATFDLVIVYHRNEMTPTNQILKAIPDGIVPAGDDRYTVKLLEVTHVGDTQSTWREFADTGANPVRRLTRANG